MVDLIIASAQLIPYRLRLSAASGQGPARSGRLIRLETTGGLKAWGDVAPLPGFSGESLEEVDTIWKLHHDSLLDRPWPWADFSTANVSVACPHFFSLSSLRFGFEQALIGLTAGARRKNPVDLIAPGYPPSIHVAGLLTRTGEDAIRDATQLVAKGYRAIKVKVGRGNQRQEIDTIVSIREAIGPDIELRLDANRAWALADAIRFAQRTATAAPAFIEEPVKDPMDARRLHEETGVSIALDETLLEITPDRLNEWSFATHIVLKPTLVGGIVASASFVDAGHELGMTPIVSGSFESGVGTQFLFYLAARWCPRGPAAGLDTYRHLETDVLSKRLPIGPTIDLADVHLEPLIAQPS